MKKRIGCLTSILLLVLNIIVLPISNAKETNDHWVKPYSDNLEQRLELINKETIEDSTRENIEILMEQVLNSSSYDSYISVSNWENLIQVIFGSEEVEDYLLKTGIKHRPITRENAVVTIMKILKEKYNLQSTELIILALKNIFNDGANVEEEKGAYISLAVSEGLISGYDDASFRPKQYLRNSEAITILEMYVGNMVFQNVKRIIILPYLKWMDT